MTTNLRALFFLRAGPCLGQQCLGTIVVLGIDEPHFVIRHIFKFVLDQLPRALGLQGEDRAEFVVGQACERFQRLDSSQSHLTGSNAIHSVQVD